MTTMDVQLLHVTINILDFFSKRGQYGYNQKQNILEWPYVVALITGHVVAVQCLGLSLCLPVSLLILSSCLSFSLSVSPSVFPLLFVNCNCCQLLRFWQAKKRARISHVECQECEGDVFILYFFVTETCLSCLSASIQATTTEG